MGTCEPNGFVRLCHSPICRRTHRRTEHRGRFKVTTPGGDQSWGQWTRSEFVIGVSGSAVCWCVPATVFPIVPAHRSQLQPSIRCSGVAPIGSKSLSGLAETTRHLRYDISSNKGSRHNSHYGSIPILTSWTVTLQTLPSGLQDTQPGVHDLHVSLHPAKQVAYASSANASPPAAVTPSPAFLTASRSLSIDMLIPPFLTHRRNFASSDRRRSTRLRCVSSDPVPGLSIENGIKFNSNETLLTNT